MTNLEKAVEHLQKSYGVAVLVQDAFKQRTYEEVAKQYNVDPVDLQERYEQLASEAE